MIDDLIYGNTEDPNATKAPATNNSAKVQLESTYKQWLQKGKAYATAKKIRIAGLLTEKTK